MYQNYLLLFILALCFVACQPNEATTEETVPANPPAEGFNLEASDEKAVAIADQVMQAMGGRAAWDATRFIKWTFFGRRNLLWDKQEQRVRIEIPRENSVYLIDLKEDSGKVRLGDIEPTMNDSLAQYVKRGKSIWINDSYWLVMPFKLKDSGVTLSYLKADTTQQGTPSDVLSLIFDGVGDTPQNMYYVYVDQEDHLVKQWDYYSTAKDSTARFANPWLDYQKFGEIMLSGNRGRGQLTNIGVLENIPDEAFTSFDHKVFE